MTIKIEQVRDFIENNYKGYSLISPVYKNCTTKMELRCGNGHIFFKRYNQIQQMAGNCPHCGGRRYAKNINDVTTMMREYHPDAQLLSEKYIDRYTKMNFICENNHAFAMSYEDLSRRRWCKVCGNKESGSKRSLDFSEVKKRFSEKHPLCTILSKEYIKNNSKLSIICEAGHNFAISFANMMNDKWCPKCAPSRIRKTMLARYGVENAYHHKDFALKAARSSNHCYIKEHWSTKEELVCVGSYESKVVDFLNKNKIKFLWQPEVFKLSNATYRPDLFLVEENKWVEIKGFFRKDALDKWHEFKAKQPNSELWDKNRLKELKIL